MTAQTSLDAYHRVKADEKDKAIRQRVYNYLCKIDNATGYEIAIAIAESILNVRPRLTELKQAELIEQVTEVTRGTEHPWRVRL